MCKVYTGYCGTSEIEHGLCACKVNNPLAKARELSLRTGAQTMLYLSLVKACLHNEDAFVCKNKKKCPGNCCYILCNNLNLVW